MKVNTRTFTPPLVSKVEIPAISEYIHGPILNAWNLVGALSCRISTRGTATSCAYVILAMSNKWPDEYVQYGFTCVSESDGTQLPNCMICNFKLRDSSPAPTKLREHFRRLHGAGQYKNTTLAEFKAKRARFDKKVDQPVGGFVPMNQRLLAASYAVAYLIAKQGEPHDVGEKLIKPCLLDVADIMLGKSAEEKFTQIPLSIDNIKDGIEDMSKDVLAQIVADLISSPAKFSLQLDETTDVYHLDQLAVFVRYVKGDEIKEDFLFCKPVMTTKTAHMKDLVDNFFKDNNLSWEMVSAVCSDGASDMLGINSGFGALVKAVAPHIIVTHCILDRHALVTKTLPPKLAEVLNIVVECVDYLQNSDSWHGIFSELCEGMGPESEVLMYHSNSNVRWLSKSKVLNRIFAMRVELAQFLQERQHCADFFDDTEFLLVLAYMADIFEALDYLNQQMQAGEVNVIETEEKLKAFQKKLQVWKRKTNKDNFVNFPLLDECVNKIEDVCAIGDISVSVELKQAIATHLDELSRSLDGYYPTGESYPPWVRQPFTFSIEAADVNDKYLDEIIEMQQSQVQQQFFITTTLSTFWSQQLATYPAIAKKALEILLPFAATDLCERSFSRMLEIRTNNRRASEDDLRLALTNVQPRISELVSKRQQQN